MKLDWVGGPYFFNLMDGENIVAQVSRLSGNHSVKYGWRTDLSGPYQGTATSAALAKKHAESALTSEEKKHATKAGC